MVLKIYIEESEEESLIDFKEGILNQLKYIVVEYHFKNESEYQNHDIYYCVWKYF